MIKNKKIKYEDKEYLILDLPLGTKEISCGLHCIGIKPLIDNNLSVVDSNGWYHVYTEMFHGYKKCENQNILDDLVDNYFFSTNPYYFPEEREDINSDFYNIMLNDYYYGEANTFENAVIFEKWH